MRKLYTSSDAMLVGHLKEVLAQHGIFSHIKNAFLGGGAGELPPIEVWPEIWVEEEDYYRAGRVLADVLEVEPAAAWRCQACGEQMEGQFGACWRCGRAAP